MSRLCIEPVSEPAISADPTKTKHPKTSCNPRRMESWPDNIDSPKNATAMVIRAIVMGPDIAVTTHSAALWITDIAYVPFCFCSM
jgi:hypothetical protein